MRSYVIFQWKDYWYERHSVGMHLSSMMIVMSQGVLTHQNDWRWRGLFIISLMFGGLILYFTESDTFLPPLTTNPWMLTVAGLLVGFGTTLGTGCTSGHAICGVSRFTKRSIFATCNMMLFAAITVFVERHVVCFKSEYSEYFPGIAAMEDSLISTSTIVGLVILVVANIIVYAIAKSIKEAPTQTSTDSYAITILSGIQFGAGLAISGMVNTYKVKGFLDFSGYWDPSLAFVMIGAYIITMPAFHFILKRRTPAVCQKFQVPTKKDLTWQLVLGSSIFGVGWGLMGICPGPGMVSFIRIYFQGADILVFLFYVIIGMYLNKALEIHLAAVAARKESEITVLNKNGVDNAPKQ